MDRRMLTEHLRQARAHARLGSGHVERQRQIIADLGRDGHDATHAEALLQAFEQTQAMHVALVDRLERELRAGR